jgi:prephenate dehydrogenase
MSEPSREEVLVERIQELQAEHDRLAANADAASVLERVIQEISQYDTAVQRIVGMHPDLAEEWRAFEELFCELTGEVLLRTADEKINKRRKSACTGCGGRGYRGR